mmetsp:Transcript_96046/g.277358  ORF Transcript_96046/g.277358 Transcript_96046/m.277358 type:complete len:266 (-) Transcript_96046:2-799(-)
MQGIARNRLLRPMPSTLRGRPVATGPQLRCGQLSPKSTRKGNLPSVPAAATLQRRRRLPSPWRQSLGAAGRRGAAATPGHRPLPRNVCSNTSPERHPKTPPWRCARRCRMAVPRRRYLHAITRPSRRSCWSQGQSLWLETPLQVVARHRGGTPGPPPENPCAGRRRPAGTKALGPGAADTGPHRQAADEPHSRPAERLPPPGLRGRWRRQSSRIPPQRAEECRDPGLATQRHRDNRLGSCFYSFLPQDADVNKQMGKRESPPHSS